MPPKRKPPGHPSGKMVQHVVHAVRACLGGGWGVYRVDWKDADIGPKGKLLGVFREEQAAEATARTLNSIQGGKECSLSAGELANGS